MKVTDTEEMFERAVHFNVDISAWNVSQVRMHMFNICLHNSSFTLIIYRQVTNMIGMFDFCKIFNQNISNWNVQNVISMDKMFYKGEEAYVEYKFA